MSFREVSTSSPRRPSLPHNPYYRPLSITCTNTFFPQPRPGALLRHVARHKCSHAWVHKSDGAWKVLAPLFRHETDLQMVDDLRPTAPPEARQLMHNSDVDGSSPPISGICKMPYSDLDVSLFGAVYDREGAPEMTRSMALNLPLLISV